MPECRDDMDHCLHHPRFLPVILPLNSCTCLTVLFLRSRSLSCVLSMFISLRIIYIHSLSPVLPSSALLLPLSIGPNTDVCTVSVFRIMRMVYVTAYLSNYGVSPISHLPAFDSHILFHVLDYFVLSCYILHLFPSDLASSEI